MNQYYKCKQCQWIGSSEELEFDKIETCMGEDDIEMCPKCGSYEVVFAPKPD